MNDPMMGQQRHHRQQQHMQQPMQVNILVLSKGNLNPTFTTITRCYRVALQQQQLQQQNNNGRNHVQVAVDSHLATGGRSQLPVIFAPAFFASAHPAAIASVNCKL